MAFVVAALCIAGVGGALGFAAVLPLNGLTIGIIDWQTFSHLAFAFCFTPLLLAAGLVFALLTGLVGGAPPAIRAACQRIAVALCELRSQ
jgi:putative ABC transport system permease protein